MNKWLKIGAAAVAFLVITVGLLFVPSVQRSIVLRVVDPGPEGEFALERIRVSWSGAEAAGLRFRQPGMEIRFDSLDTRFPLGRVLFRQQVDIRSLELLGLVVDLTVPPGDKPKPEPRPEDVPEIFEGILDQIEWPSAVTLTDAKIDGRLLLPDNGRVVEIPFQLQGGQKFTSVFSNQAIFQFTAGVENPMEAVSRLNLKGDFSLSLQTGGLTRDVSLNTRGTVESDALAQPETLAARIILARTDGGEHYQFELSRVGDEGDARWIEIMAAYRAAERKFDGRWTFDLPDDQTTALLRAFAVNGEQPALELASNGRFSFGLDDGRWAASGEILGQAERLGRLLPELATLESAALESRFDLAGAPDYLEAREWSADLRGGGAELLQARLLRPFIHRFEKAPLEGAAGGEDLLTVRLGEIPPALIEPWLREEGKTVSLTGGGLAGLLVLRAADNGLVLATRDPLRAGPLTYAVDGEPVVRDVRLEAAGEGTWSPDRWRAVLSEARVTDGEGDILRLSADYEDRGAFRAELLAHLAAAARQPLLAGGGGIPGGELRMKAEGTTEGGGLAGSWELRLESEQEGLSAEGSGRFAHAEGGPSSFEGELRAGLSGLAAFVPELAALEAVTLAARFDADLAEDIFQLRSAEISLREEGAAPVLEIANSRPFRYDLSAGTLLEMEGRARLADLKLGGIPIEWAGLFLADETTEGRSPLREGKISGHVAVHGENGAVSLTMEEPLRITPFDYMTAEGVGLLGVSALVNASAHWRDEALSVDVEEARFDGARGEIARLAGRLGEDGAFSARLRADLPRLLAQPLIGAGDPLHTGTAELDIEGRWSEEATMARAQGTLREARSANGRQPLPDVSFNADVRRESAVRWVLDLPLSLEQALVKSDARLAGFLEIPDDGDFRFDLDLSGDRIVLDQLLGWIDLFAEEEEPVAPGATSAEERDDTPFWSGFQGRLGFDIGALVLEGEQAVNEIKGELTLAPDSLTPALRAVFLDSPVNFEGGLGFDAERENPYRLRGGLSAPRLNAAEWFRSADATRPPTVEGRFALNAEVRGEERNMDRLLENYLLDVSLQSDGGVYRLFWTENPVARFGVAGAGLAASLLGGEFRSVIELADSLSNLRYDTMNLQVRRDETLNFVLEDFRVLSPDLHVAGSGGLLHREGVPLLLQPLDIRLEIGARNRPGRLLSNLRVLGDRQNELGYQMMTRQFRIGGTPSNPDNADFYRYLVESAARLLLPQPRGREQPEAPGETEARQPAQPGVGPLIEGVLDEIFGRGRREPDRR